jgi:Nucleotidyl transferase
MPGHGATILLQSADRGTAAGVLLPVHWILSRASGATVAVFSSDHLVLEEEAFMDQVAQAAAFVDENPGRIVLLGIPATAPETEYGWIEPGPMLGRAGRTPSGRSIDSSRSRPRTKRARAWQPEHRGRPSASVNFVTAHDGFTLLDLVSFNHKHNEANGEENRNGTSANLSWNCGVEGATDDAAVTALRERMLRNFLVTLFLSQGVPMLLAGDEFGRTQQSNNNAYCQDNRNVLTGERVETATREGRPVLPLEAARSRASRWRSS